MSIEIVCDKGREEPIAWLEDESLHCPFPLKIEQIAVGDYAIVKNGKIVVSIERKTWTDLADTIKDPKRKANHQKLLKLRDECGCSIVYIIEGAAFPSPDHKFARVPYKNLLAYLHHIMIRDRCSYIQTKNVRHTAEMIIDLAKSVSTIVDNEKTGAAEQADIPDALSRLKKREPITNDTITEAMLLAIPGVTSVSLPAIKKNCSIKSLVCNNMHSEISELKYISGKKFGDKRATTINTSAKQKTTHSMMLTAIPGVTNKTADIILEKYTMPDIILGRVSENDLASLVKSTSTKIVDGEVKNKSTKIGKALANKILSSIKSNDDIN